MSLYTFSSRGNGCIDISDQDATTKLISKALVSPGPLTLISLFGYNNGAQEFLQLHDAASVAGVAANAQPLHTFVMGASNNYSLIVPLTGIGFDFGLVIAISSTAAKYTAGASKDITFCGTLKFGY